MGALILCDLEDTQQPDAAQHRNTERRHDVRVGQHHFDDAAKNDKAIESIEQWHEVSLKAQTVHFQDHLHGKQCDKEHVRGLCKLASN